MSLRRIVRDLVDVSNHAHTSYGVQPLDIGDLYNLHANIRLDYGRYKGAMIHIHIKIPTTYPFDPPSGWVSSGHPFTNRFHSHLIPQIMEFSSDDRLSICFPLFENFRTHFSRDEGWKPGISLHQLLTHLTLFLTESTDLPLEQTPSMEQVITMIKESNMYQCPQCGNGPPIPEQTVDTCDDSPGCYFSNHTLTTRPKMVLGAPVIRNKIQMGLLSRQSYVEQRVMSRLVTHKGERYHYWVPLLVHPTHATRVYPFLIENNGSLFESFLVYAELMINLLVRMVRTDTTDQDDRSVIGINKQSVKILIYVFHTLLELGNVSSVRSKLGHIIDRFISRPNRGDNLGQLYLIHLISSNPSRLFRDVFLLQTLRRRGFVDNQRSGFNRAKHLHQDHRVGNLVFGLLTSCFDRLHPSEIRYDGFSLSEQTVESGMDMIKGVVEQDWSDPITSWERLGFTLDRVSIVRMTG